MNQGAVVPEQDDDEDSGSAKYNEMPAEWRLRTYDPACEPRELVAPLLNATLQGEPRDDRLIILMFGDRCARCPK